MRMQVGVPKSVPCVSRPRLWFCVSTRPWSMRVRASAVSPDIAQPMCSSISRIFSMLLGS